MHDAGAADAVCSHPGGLCAAGLQNGATVDGDCGAHFDGSNTTGVTHEDAACDSHLVGSADCAATGAAHNDRVIGARPEVHLAGCAGFGAAAGVVHDGPDGAHLDVWGECAAESDDAHEDTVDGALGAHWVELTLTGTAHVEEAVGADTVAHLNRGAGCASDGSAATSTGWASVDAVDATGCIVCPPITAPTDPVPSEPAFPTVPSAPAAPVLAVAVAPVLWAPTAPAFVGLVSPTIPAFRTVVSVPVVATGCPAMTAPTVPAPSPPAFPTVPLAPAAVVLAVAVAPVLWVPAALVLLTPAAPALAVLVAPAIPACRIVAVPLVRVALAVSAVSAVAAAAAGCAPEN